MRIKNILRTLFLLIIVGLIAGPGGSQAALAQTGQYEPSPPVFSPAGDGQSTFSLQSSIPNFILRSRKVNVNLDALTQDGQVKLSSDRNYISYSFNLFSNTDLQVVFHKVERSGKFKSYIGSVPGDRGSEVVMTVGSGIMHANLNLSNASYQIRYAEGEGHTISQVDYSALPQEKEPQIPDFIPTTASLDGPSLQSTAFSTLDVMVVYTPAARVKAGGLASIKAKINTAIAESNTGVSNSSIAQKFRLVHSQEVNYIEPSQDAFGKALNQITANNDGIIDNVHNLRKIYGADLVVFLIDDYQYCGIGWLMTPEWLSTAFSKLAFSVVSINCATGSYSFAHEIGHNMGAGHDAYVNGYGAYAYSKGFVHLASQSLTIMSYYNKCSANNQYCYRRNLWSGNNVYFEGILMGGKGARNNLTLNNTRAIVENFMPKVMGKPGKPIPISPADGVFSNPPSFVWQPGTGKRIIKYRVVIKDQHTNALIKRKVIKAVNICFEGTCTFTPVLPLSGTDLKWHVKAYNRSGWGKFSAWQFFSLAPLMKSTIRFHPSK
ncbi:MAG: zinc-dependent metalloprotease [Anaerolineae bacterium]|nr:zinc-dependent metalloprotease [Anaerolineae bacterium]